LVERVLALKGRSIMKDKVPRGPKGKRRYVMDYIPDKTLFAAVMFARKMIREGTPPGIANTRAAAYYEVSVRDVARYVGQAGGTSAQRRRRS
jgi:hypothetical protein